MAAGLTAIPGEQNEGTADALLPDVCPKAVIPGPRQAPEIHQIPAEVIGDHAEQGLSTKGI